MSHWMRTEDGALSGVDLVAASCPSSRSRETYPGISLGVPPEEISRTRPGFQGERTGNSIFCFKNVLKLGAGGLRV
jgi:hypothetical protein